MNGHDVSAVTIITVFTYFSIVRVCDAWAKRSDAYARTVEAARATERARYPQADVEPEEDDQP